MSMSNQEEIDHDAIIRRQSVIREFLHPYYDKNIDLIITEQLTSLRSFQDLSLLIFCQEVPPYRLLRRIS